MKICGAILIIIIVLGAAGLWKKKVFMLLLFTSAAVFTAEVLYEATNPPKEIQWIEKNKAGTGDKSRKVTASTGDRKTELELTIPEQAYSDPEKERILDAEVEYLDKTLLGQNVEPDDICHDMELPSHGQNEKVQIEWYSSDPEIMGSNGEIKDGADKNGQDVTITGILRLDDTERRYEQKLTVFQRAATGNRKKDLEDAVRIENKENESERYLLPKKIGDSDIKWYESGENKAPYIAVLILILGIFYIWAGKRKEEEKNKKRTDDLKKEYPELIGRIILLLYSGATMRNALFYIGDSYRKSMTGMKDRKKNEAFEEVVITCRQMQSGVTELKAYGNMADRCALPCYRTLSIMLMQNQKRGSKGMIASLEQEVINEFAEKKRKVKSEGEIASMKLLLPLGLMLMIVFALMMIPAFFSI